MTIRAVLRRIASRLAISLRTGVDPAANYAADDRQPDAVRSHWLRLFRGRLDCPPRMVLVRVNGTCPRVAVAVRLCGCNPVSLGAVPCRDVLVHGVAPWLDFSR